MAGLTDSQQSYFMLLAFVLVPIGTWAGLGLPTDKMSLGLLTSSIIVGIILFVKERLGTSPPTTPPQPGA